jgi:class 3 adenylate cyclase
MRATMEPRIQYAKTSDGVSIAYTVFGDGPPIVFVGTGFGDVHVYSSGVLLTEITDTLVGLGWRFIMYDCRGAGSSERGNTDFSLEARLRDLEAVIERTVIDRFALFSILQGGPTAIAYAVKHPVRVAGLVLTATYARGADFNKGMPAVRATRALDAMAEEQWEYYTLALANAITGFKDSDLANRIAVVLRSGTSAKTYLSFLAENEKIDVTDLLPLVSVPTLVVHIGANPLSNIDLLRVLASRTPDARLVSTEDPVRAIDAFLREGEEQAATPKDLPSGTAVILFADIADSTALTERLGDTAFRAKARDLDASLRTLIREHTGTPVEGPTLGDGVLAVFTSARQAIEAALACARAGNDAGLPLHLGLHAGDVIREENNVYGGAVNIASRISGLSAPGEVLVSDTVRSLARTSARVTFEDRGNQRLKGVLDAVRVWAVKPADGSIERQPHGGAKAPYPGDLTPREIEVLRLIATGRTNDEISRELVLSERTVARHITNIYGKIGARSKVDAASYAIRHGLMAT